MTETMIDYKAHGYDSKDHYLDCLREEYGTGLVDALISVLPESEYFDGLITELEDNFQGFGGDFACGFDLFG